MVRCGAGGGGRGGRQQLCPPGGPCRFLQVSEEVEVLRLAHFFGNAPMLTQLCDSLGRQLGGLGEAEVLQVGRCTTPPLAKAQQASSQRGRGTPMLVPVKPAPVLACMHPCQRRQARPSLSMPVPGVPRRLRPQAAPSGDRVPGAAAAAVWQHAQRGDRQARGGAGRVPPKRQGAGLSFRMRAAASLQRAPG